MNKELIKKGFIVGLIGFAVGIPVGIAFLMISSSEDWSAMRIAVHLLLSGVLGGVALGSSVMYEAESWSVTRCTVTHFIVTFTTYFAIGFSLGWLSLDDISTYIMVGCMVVAYFMVWLSMYLVSKKEAKELDEMLSEWKKNNHENADHEKDTI